MKQTAKDWLNMIVGDDLSQKALAGLCAVAVESTCGGDYRVSIKE
jgi:hypothetical protein